MTTRPILTEEEIKEAAESHADIMGERWTCIVEDYTQGARFALAAAERREALWQRLNRCTSASEHCELRAALGIDKEG